MATSTNATSARPHICVFCGSQSGNDPAFIKAAQGLAQQIHKHNGILVYGAGSTGVMGELSSTLVKLSGPGAVLGIVPKHLVRVERPYNEDIYGQVEVVEDMQERMQSMMSKVINSQIGLPDKPVVAISASGYYDGIAAQSHTGVEKGLVRKEGADKLAIFDTAEDAMKCLIGA